MKIAIDFEFITREGHLFPICVAINESTSHLTRSWWLWKGEEKESFIEYVNAHKNDIWVAHCIEIAEARCFCELGLDCRDFKWFDTFVVEKILNNKTTKDFEGHLGLLEVTKKYLGESEDQAYKDSMRNMILGPEAMWDRGAILKYCESDVANLTTISSMQVDIYNKMEVAFVMNDIFGNDYIFDESHLISFSNVSSCYAYMDFVGIPLNKPIFDKMLKFAPKLVQKMKEEFNNKYDVYNIKIHKKLGTIEYTLSNVAMQSIVDKIINENNVGGYPKTSSGKYSLSDDDLKQLEQYSDFIVEYREHSKMVKLLNGIAVGKRNNGRIEKWSDNYCPSEGRIHPEHMPMMTVTGRTTAKPKSGWIPGWSKTLRSLISPSEEGKVLVALDYSGEENAISASWGEDENMRDAYYSDDYYIHIGKQIGVVPQDATKKSHKEIRNKVLKPLILGKLYGMGDKSLQQRLNKPIEEVSELSSNYEDNFASYYDLRLQFRDLHSITTEDTIYALKDGYIIIDVPPSKFGDADKVNTFLNFPIQGQGASILRYIVLNARDRNVNIVTTVHDEIYFECDEENLEETINKAQELMKEAYQVVCGDFCKIKIGEPEIIRYGDVVFHEDWSKPQWNKLIEMLNTF